MYGKPKIEGSGKPSQAIEVTDIKNNITTSYDSIHEAARALNIYSHNIIRNYIKNNQKKPYKGKYTFKKSIEINKVICKIIWTVTNDPFKKRVNFTSPHFFNSLKK